MRIPSTQIIANYQEYKGLIQTSVLQDLRSPFFNAALTRVLILVRDMLANSEKFSKRVSFSDNMKTNGHIKDVTDLVKFYRDAACHLDSNSFDYRGIRFSFIATHSKFDGKIMNNKYLSADFEDDTCIFLAREKLYINRHLIRAYDQAIQNLSPSVPFEFV